MNLTSTHSNILTHAWKQKICTPVLYMLPAIHRAPPVSLKFADRPIISTYGSPTMIQIYGRFCFPFYAKYTSHILEILKATPFPTKYYLWSLTWYPNTPQEVLLKLNALQETFEKHWKTCAGWNLYPLLYCTFVLS